MAIIYSYPLYAPKPEDLLIGTVTLDENAAVPIYDNPTVSFTIQSIVDLIAPVAGLQNLQSVTAVGATTTNTVTFSSDIKVTGRIYDSGGGAGATGEILSSLGTGTAWITNTPGGVTSVTPSNSTFITITQNATSGAITTTSVLSATGLSATPAVRETQYLRGDNTWATVSTGTTYQPGAGLTLDTTTSPDTFKVDYLGTDNVVLSAGTAVTPDGADTIIINDATTGNVVQALISGLPFDAYDKWILRGDNYDATVAATSQDVDSGEVMDVAGGTIIDTVVGDTRKVTINHGDLTVTQTDNTGTPLTPAFGDNIDLVASASGTTQGHMNTVVTNRITIPSNPVFIGPADATTDGIIGIVPAPAQATFDGGYFLRQDATWSVPPDTKLTTITTNSGTVSTGAPLTGSIDAAGEVLTITSKYFGGGSNVGYVPASVDNTQFLKGDGTWSSIPTGLNYQGVWAASTTAEVATQSGTNLTIVTADASLIVGTIVEGTGTSGTIKIATVTDSSTFVLDTSVTVSAGTILTMSAPGGAPVLTGTGLQGDGILYICTVAGKAYPNNFRSTNPIATPGDWNVGDWCVFTGTAGSGEWTRIPVTNAGVTSFTSNFTAAGASDPQYITGTTFSGKTGAVDIGRVNLTNTNGTSDTATRFLSKDNTWDIPSYSTNTNTTYDFLAVGTVPTFALNAGSGTGYTAGVNLPTTATNDVGGATTGTGMTVDTTVNGSGVITLVTINNPGDLYNVGDIVTITGTTATIILSGTGSNNANPNLRLIDSAFAFEDVKLTGTGGATITRTSDTGITINSLNTQNTYTAGAGLALSSFEFSALINTTAADANTQGLDASPPSDRFYAVQLDNNSTAADRKMVVNIPWTSGGSYNWILDADSSGTTRTVASGNTIDFIGVGGITIGHSTTGTTTDVTFTGTTYGQVDSVIGGTGIVVDSSTATAPSVAIRYTDSSTGADDNIITGAVDIGGATIATDDFILISDLSTDPDVVKKAAVSKLPFTNNLGTVTEVDTGVGLDGGPFSSSGTISVMYTGTNNVILDATASTDHESTSRMMLNYDNGGGSIAVVNEMKLEDIQLGYFDNNLNWAPAASVFTGVTDCGTTPVVGTSGLVPTPTVSDCNKFLKSDGNWTVLPVDPDTNTTYSIDVPLSTTNINLKGADPASNDAITLTESTGISITRNNESQLTFANTGVVSLNMPNTGPGEGGILLTANTGTIDIGVDYLGGNNIISTAYAGSGAIPTTAHIMWAETTSVKKVYYSDVADLPFASSSASGTVTSITGGNGITASASSTIPSVQVDYTNSAANLINSALISAITVPDADSILILKTTGSAVGTVERTPISNLPFSNSSGTVTSVAALTLGTTGTDLSSTVAGGTGSAVITLQVPSASAANRGALTAADWTTFNNKTSNTGTVTGVTGTAPVVSSGGTAPAISMAKATASVDGYLSSTDWSTFNGKTSNTGTVTSITLAAGSGSGTALTTSGTFTFTAGTNVSTSVSGTTVTINSTDQYVGTVTGTGTANYVSKWSTGSNQVNSVLRDDGTGVAIGNTPDANYRMLIEGAVSGYKHIGTGNGDVGFYTKNEGTATANILYQADANIGGTNTTVFTVISSGTLEVKGDIVAFGSPSDERLKENIKPIESALDKAMKLQGVTFDWKEKDGKILDLKEDIGFIAQDVQKIIPELVRENENGILSMRHQGVAPILLEAIKELKQEIEELKLNKCNCNCNK